MEKVAVVTGASKGIGKACAELLLEEGFYVYGGSPSPSSISHENFTDIELDFSRSKSINSFLSELEKDTEVIDLVILAGGSYGFELLEEASFEIIQSYFTTQSTGKFHFLKKCSEFFIEQETQVVGFNVLFSQSTVSTDIAALKACESALCELIDSFAINWISRGVRFHRLKVGATKTQFWQGFDDLEINSMLQVTDVKKMVKFIINSPEHITFKNIELHHKTNLI